MRIQSEETKTLAFWVAKGSIRKDDLFQATLFKQSDGIADCQFFKSEEIYDNVRIDPEKISSELVLDVFVLEQS